MNNQLQVQGSESKSDFWARHLAGWKDSGLNVREYCELEDLSTSAFGYWRRKLSSPKPRSEGFVELPVRSERRDSLVRVRLKSGLELGVVPGTDTRYVAELVGALERTIDAH